MSDILLKADLDLFNLEFNLILQHGELLRRSAQNCDIIKIYIEFCNFSEFIDQMQRIFRIVSYISLRLLYSYKKTYFTRENKSNSMIFTNLMFTTCLCQNVFPF